MRVVIVLELEADDRRHGEKIAEALADQAEATILMTARSEYFTCEEKIA